MWSDPHTAANLQVFFAELFFFWIAKAIQKKNNSEKNNSDLR